MSAITWRDRVALLKGRHDREAAGEGHAGSGAFADGRGLHAAARLPSGAVDEPVAASVVIVNYRGRGRLGRCLDALAASPATCRFETHRRRQRLRRRLLGRGRRRRDGCRARAQRRERRLRARLQPGGRRVARGRHLVFLNFDCEPQAGWLDALVRCADDDPGVGAAQAVVLHPDGTVNTAGNRLHYLGFSWAPNGGSPPVRCRRRRSRSARAPACSFRRSCFREVGGFWEAMFLYCEDTDLCWRLRLAGLRILVCPDARVRARLRLRPQRLQVLPPRAQPPAHARSQLRAARRSPGSRRRCSATELALLAVAAARRAGCRRSCARSPPPHGRCRPCGEQRRAVALPAADSGQRASRRQLERRLGPEFGEGIARCRAHRCSRPTRASSGCVGLAAAAPERRRARQRPRTGAASHATASASVRSGVNSRRERRAPPGLRAHGRARSPSSARRALARRPPDHRPAPPSQRPPRRRALPSASPCVQTIGHAGAEEIEQPRALGQPVLDAVVGQAERAGGLREQLAAARPARPREALDAVADAQAAAAAQHRVERVRRLAARMRGRRGCADAPRGARARPARTPRSPSHRRTTARARRTRARVARRGRRRPAAAAARPSAPGRRAAACARAPRARAPTASPWHTRAAARWRRAAGRRAQSARARAGGSPRSAHRRGRAGRARRVPARSSRRTSAQPGRQATCELRRLVGEPLRADDGGVAPREFERPRQRPVGVAPRPARRERRLDAVAAQLVGELAVAQRRPGDLERGGVSRRRRDDQHLRHRPEFRPRRVESFRYARAGEERADGCPAASARWARRRHRWGAAVVALVLMPLIGVHDARRPVYGPIDEVTHTAYVLAVATGRHPALARPRPRIHPTPGPLAPRDVRIPDARQGGSAPVPIGTFGDVSASRRRSSRRSTTTPPRL